MDYEAVIGLEVHAELSTESKIYCTCANRFGAEVNTLCCPVCTGMPGILPSLNALVIEYAVKMGLACGCRIADIVKQDRKSYFYPDLPKGYQISQFDIPLCEDGAVEFYSAGQRKKVRIRRIHIEDDAGKLLHDESFGGSLVDFNRCGVPLIEIVSEPDLRSSAEAKDYLEMIKLMLLYLGISDAKMQEGSLRCDVNVSLRERGSDMMGTRCEMKNVSSFSAVMRAIDYEIERQTEILSSGGSIVQETRRWDDAKGQSVPLRSKEDAHDYRYFPEPNIPVITGIHAIRDRVAHELPELPMARILRYEGWGLSNYEAVTLTNAPDRADYFDRCAAAGGASYKAIANWVLGELSKLCNARNCAMDELGIEPRALTSLAALAESGTVSSTGAKRVLEIMLAEGGEPEDIAKKHNLIQNNDEEALAKLARSVVDSNPDSVKAYRAGKTNAIGYLVGQAMKASKGQANPQMLQKLIREIIEG